MAPADKLELVRQMTQAVQQMALAGISRRYPKATPREQRLRLASLWLDAETMQRAFGWDPDRERREGACRTH